MRGKVIVVQFSYWNDVSVREDLEIYYKVDFCERVSKFLLEVSSVGLSELVSRW
jgi:hypothetical protein